jgi:ESCRT-II complex subunit VPS25
MRSITADCGSCATINLSFPGSTSSRFSIWNGISSHFRVSAIFYVFLLIRKQINVDTWNKQKLLWTEIILKHAQHNNKYTYFVDTSIDPFLNRKINRKLDPSTLQEIFDEMVRVGRASKAGESYKILVKTLREWADLIYGWVADTGRTNTVCTRYEILEEPDQPFTHLDEQIFTLAIDLLVKDGKATVFSSADGNVGVKFSA